MSTQIPKLRWRRWARFSRGNWVSVSLLPALWPIACRFHPTPKHGKACLVGGCKADLHKVCPRSPACRHTLFTWVFCKVRQQACLLQQESCVCLASDNSIFQSITFLLCYSYTLLFEAEGASENTQKPHLKTHLKEAGGEKTMWNVKHETKLYSERNHHKQL